MRLHYNLTPAEAEGRSSASSEADEVQRAALRLPKLKNDQYRRARGGHAAFLILACSTCQETLLLYQKDGEGALRRCYLNRIFAPARLALMQDDPDVHTPHDMPSLKCPRCLTIIGQPMRHHEGRLAYRLNEGTFKKTKIR